MENDAKYHFWITNPVIIIPYLHYFSCTVIPCLRRISFMWHFVDPNWPWLSSTPSPILWWHQSGQDRECMYTATLVQSKPLLQQKCNKAFCICHWATCNQKLHKHNVCCTTILWQFHVTSKNKMYVGLHAGCLMLHWNKRTFIWS